MSRWSWRHPEHRKDLYIVLGLFAVGFLFSAVAGLVVMWVLQQLGWWDVALMVRGFVELPIGGA